MTLTGVVRELIELEGCSTDARGERQDIISHGRSGCATDAHHRDRLMGEQSLSHRARSRTVLGRDHGQDSGSGRVAAHRGLPAVHRDVRPEVEDIQTDPASCCRKRQGTELVLAARRQANDDGWAPGPAAGGEERC